MRSQPAPSRRAPQPMAALRAGRSKGLLPFLLAISVAGAAPLLAWAQAATEPSGAPPAVAAAPAAVPAAALPTSSAPGDRSQRAADDPLRHLEFVQEPSAQCVSRNAMQVLVRNDHPTRSLKVWLDRWHMGVGTGDRSRSVLRPGAEADALGCTRSLNGPQEWRVVRAEWVD